MTDENGSNEPGLDVPVLHFAHRHCAMISYLLDQGDQIRAQDIEGRKKPNPTPYAELHKYLAEHDVIKSFPRQNGGEPYIFTKPSDFDDMLQDDWWLMIRALTSTIVGARVRAREAAKK